MADNKEEIKCPACGSDMKKIFMHEQGINIDVCVDGCGGIYFDNREFEKFDEKHEDISPLEEVYKGKQFKEVDKTQIRNCPVCGMKMVKNYSSAKKQVEIDECYNCGGKFLDYNELNKIRDEYETEVERANDAIDKYSETQEAQELLKNSQMHNSGTKRRNITTKIIYGFAGFIKDRL